MNMKWEGIYVFEGQCRSPRASSLTHTTSTPTTAVVLCTCLAVHAAVLRTLAAQRTSQLSPSTFKSLILSFSMNSFSASAYCSREERAECSTSKHTPAGGLQGAWSLAHMYTHAVQSSVTAIKGFKRTIRTLSL